MSFVNDINLSKIQEAKLKLQSGIEEKISDFTKETGLKVTSIDVNNHEALNLSGKLQAVLYIVKTHIEV